MVIYLYRWRLKSGKERQFEKAWAYVTEQLRENGSLGSRLHIGSDGLWYGYAQWPSQDVREQVNIQHPEYLEARSLMKDAILEELSEVLLRPLADYLVSK